MIPVFTKMYHGQYYPETRVRVVRVTPVSGESKLLGDSTCLSWGAKSKSADQLAFLVLQDAFGRLFAKQKWEDFSSKVIKSLPENGWIITKESIAEMYAAELTVLSLAEVGEPK